MFRKIRWDALEEALPRSPISKEIETNVLVKSRRRCCICFGLNRDTALKSGQIAHLDRDSSNSSEDNLAFLCLHHHDEYDSRTSQRKGLQLAEVKQFRSELVVAINKAFEQPVHFGALHLPPEDPYAGQWIRLGSGEDSAEILLTPLPETMEGDARYFVSGNALWGAGRPYGPNLGSLDYVATMDEVNLLVLSRSAVADEGTANTYLKFIAVDLLHVEEHNVVGLYGMNVTFAGTYKRGSLHN